LSVRDGANKEWLWTYDDRVPNPTGSSGESGSTNADKNLVALLDTKRHRSMTQSSGDSGTSVMQEDRNIDLLRRNIDINGLAEQIRLLPMAAGCQGSPAPAAIR
jgi:hypothetical protein